MDSNKKNVKSKSMVNEYRQMINEKFNWGVKAQKNPRSGSRYFIAYIDGLSSEPVYPYRQKVAELGAKWDSFNKYWYVALPSDPEKRETYIQEKLKPVIEYLKSVEKEGEQGVDEELQGIINQIDKLIQNIEAGTVKGDTQEVDTAMDPQEIKQRLQNFKEELLASFKDEGWKQKMMPIIKFRKAQGVKFSILNSILVMIQDPEATLVKSIGNWQKANKRVGDNAPMISLWLPKGTPLFKTPREKQMAKEDWLRRNRKDEKTLSVGEREIMMRFVNQFDPTQPVRFSLEPKWCDVRFTVQMDGKEDLIGSNDGEVEWFDGKTPENEKSIKLYDAMIEIIKSAGITLTYGDSSTLGGARGVSKNGEIEVLKDSPKDVGSVSTLVHEFSHELLHQKYLSKEDKTGWGRFFVGTEQGRGMIEQQAEISAWIVMRNFGFDMQAARNYVGCWGGSDESCVKVFDTVADVASEIIQRLENALASSNVSENKNLVENTLTGAEVAQMVGSEAEEAYQRGKMKMQMKRVNENFHRFLNRMEKSGKDAMTKNMTKF